MRILFVALSLPFPPTNGHRLRTWAMLQSLAEDGHQISLLSFVDLDERVESDNPLLALCQKVELLPTPRPISGATGTLLRRARTLPSRLPHGVWRFRWPPLIKRIQAELAANRFDLVLCDGVYNMANVPASTSVPVVLNKDDVAHVIMRRYLHFEPNPAKKLYAWLEAEKLRWWEKQTCQRAAVVLACSDRDQAILQSLCPETSIRVVPNVVDTDHYVALEEEEAPTVLYQGGMDWYPNQDAVEFFISEIFPVLRGLLPGVSFRVAGRSPSEKLRRRLAGVPGIEFTGMVPDIRREIARAAVCVVPLRIGSGTRLKILEAAAMAKPIVSTRLGAEGLHFVDGEEILLADEPQQFARAVAGLLANKMRRRAMGRAARRRVEQQYSLSVLRGALREALSDLNRKPLPASENLELRFCGNRTRS